ncbi:hypothetical protein [Parabacteroides distasonis]
MNRLLIYFFKFKHKTYLSPEKPDSPGLPITNCQS